MTPEQLLSLLALLADLRTQIERLGNENRALREQNDDKEDGRG